MAKDIKFNVKLMVDGKEQLASATTTTKELRNAINATQSGVSALNESLLNFNQYVTKVQNVTDAFSQLANTLNSLTEESRQFADAMAAANTMAGKSGGDFEQLKGQVADLAKTIPIARDALAKGLYQVVSNGVPEDNWISYLEASAKASVGGIADLEEVVKVTSTVIKNYGLSWEEAESIQDKIQLTAKNGVTSFEQLAQALPRVTANAATLGVGINDLMAVFATLTGVSGNTAEVSTQLAAVFTALIKPSSEATEMAKQMGIQFDAASIKAAGGLQTFLKELDKSVKAYSSKSGMLEQTIYGKLFSSAESLRALVPLTGNLSEKFDVNAKAMEDSADTIEGAFEGMSDTVEAKLQVLKNQFAGIGDTLNGLTEWIQPVLNFTSQAGMAVVGVLALRKAMVGLSIGTRVASTAVAAFGPIVQVARAAMTGATVSATTLRTAIKTLYISTGVGVAIWALTEAISYFASKSDEAANKADDLGEGMSDMADEVKSAYDSTLKSTYANLMNTYEKLKGAWKSLTTEQQKLDWISKNQGAFKELRLKITSVSDAEDVFKGKTDEIVKAFEKRAQAAAYAAKLTELYKKQLEKKTAIKDAEKEADKIRQDYINSDPLAAKEAERRGIAPAMVNRGLYADLKKVNDEIADTKKELASLGDTNAPITVSHTPAETTTSTTSGTHATTSNNAPAVNGSIDWYEEKLQNLKKQITATSDESLAASLQADYEKAEAELEELKKRIGLVKPEPIEVKVKTHLEELKDQLDAAQDEFDNAVTIEAKVTADAKVSDIQAQIDRATNGNVTIKADVEPGYIVQGSASDIRQSYSNAQNRASQIQSDFDAGIIDTDEAKRQIDELNEQIASLGKGIKPFKLKIDTSSFGKAMSGIKDGWSGVSGIGNGIQSITDALDSDANAWSKLSSVINGALSIAEGISGIVTLINMLTATTQAHAAAATADAVASSSEAAAATAATAAKSGEAVADATSAGAKLPFPANLAAIAAGVAAVIAALAMVSKFATGGVVGGSSVSGDKKFVRVNSGEMILNKQQQAHLFGLIEGRFNPPAFYDRSLPSVSAQNLAKGIEPTTTEVNINMNANARKILDLMFDTRRVAAKSGKKYNL